MVLSSEALQFYCEYGMKYGKAKVEAVEDIEILRFIENGYKVQYIEVNSETVAVDTPNDLEKVRDCCRQDCKGRNCNLNKCADYLGRYIYIYIFPGNFAIRRKSNETYKCA